MFEIPLITAHKVSPVTVGSNIERTVHFTLFVSLYIVIQVVAHGKCISAKTTKQMAVVKVHPFDCKSTHIFESDDASTIAPVLIYPIKIIGTTISFAGKPSKNPIKIIPSSPKNDANGCNVSAHSFKIELSDI